MSAEQTAALASQLADLTLAERLRAVRSAVAGKIVFTTSLGLEDQALTHLIAEAGVDIQFATLDTGRLFPETYTVWRETEARYGIRIQPFYPKHDALEDLVSRQGIDGFYGSIDARKACCGVRKIEPLGRALKGAAVWVTGLRADQSDNRSNVAVVEWDEARGLFKLNPLIDWSREKTVAFVEANAVPINPLHGQGFLSIGCAPCTRAVQPGEPERAGRWWWEDETKKECGLHIGPDGKISRAATPAEARP
jgi:phosphoadenosine phosphosulfate reductase